MKNYINKTIVGILSFVLLFVGAQSVFASGPFNGQSGDCNPGIGIGVYNVNIPKDSQGCWSANSITAKAGDTINVAMYYHNNTSSPLTNVSGSIVKSSSGPANSYTFTGRMYSDQGSTTVGTVTLNLTSSQSITYSSTHWMKDANAIKSDTDTKVFNNDGGQISIGTVPPGWNDYGEFLVVYKVSNTVVPELCKDTTATNYGGPMPCVYPQAVCKINNFSASPASILKDSSSLLTWNTSNCSNVVISDIGSYPASGSKSVYPSSTTTYTLKAYGSNGSLSDTSTTTVNVSTPQVMTGNLDASYPSCVIASGNSTCSIPFSWSTQNPESVSSVTSNGYTVATGNSGSKTFSVKYGSSSYYFYNNSKLLDTENVSASCATSSYWDGFSCKENVVQTCSINNFSTSSSSITSGGSAVLSWSTSNCNSVTVYPTVGTTSTSGTSTVWPTNSTTYTLTAYGSTGLAQTRTVTVNVSTPQLMTGNLDASYPSCVITSGNSTCTIPFSWSTQNPESVSSVTSNGYTVATGNSGSKTFSVKYGSSSYYFYNNSKLLDTENVSASCATSSYWDGSFCKTNVVPQNCSINNFSTSSSSITSGGSAVLSWSTSNCNSVTVYPTVGTTSTSGTSTVWPTNSTTYTLTAYGSTGLAQTRTVTVNVSIQDNKTCQITSFYSDDTSIENGDSVLLRWNTENCNSVSISGLASSLNSNGSYRAYPNSTKTYTLKASGDYGSDSESLKIYVDDNNNNSSCSIDSFTASNTYLNQGDPSVLNWTTTGCTNVNISSIGNVGSYGNKIVYPYNTTTYILTAYGSNSGTRTKSITVNVNYNNPIIIAPVVPTIIYNSNVVTTVATNISQTGAQLNGLITNSGYTNSNVHFEYGTSVNLGLRTATKTLTGNTNFSEYVSGLSPYTIYYFQAVSEGSNGVSRGAIEVFRTLGVETNNNNYSNTTTKTIFVQQGTTVIGSESPIMLKIENRYQSIGVNDIIEYTVTYKNIGNVTLLNPILQVIVPKGIILTNYTKGTYAQDTNTLTVQLYDLAAGEEGFINLQGQVFSMPSDTAQIVTTAVLVYTNRNGSQENAMAYVLNSQKLINNNLLGASAFFLGIFPSSLIGWLFLLILILLLILLARSLYARRDVVTTTTQKTISH